VHEAEDFARHVDYVHCNPVKHGLAMHAGSWPYWSFRRAVAPGDYPPDWAHEGDAAGAFWERSTLSRTDAGVGCGRWQRACDSDEGGVRKGTVPYVLLGVRKILKGN
jgi:hypothetical protein